MKRRLFILTFVIISSIINGQKPDSLSINHWPHHFITINPLNSALFHQTGITYEYKSPRFGFGISSGYIYSGKSNFSRLFIAGTTEHGALEHYSGFFIIPQINIYLTEIKSTKKTTVCYLGFKGVYKKLQIDSTDYYIWDKSAPQYYWKYRKQVDKLNISGTFIVFGFKHISKHFLFDFNLGPGMLDFNHNIVVAGEGWKMPSNYSNINPPRFEVLREEHFTFNISINLGIAL